jgi:hypothetical protein
MSVIDEIIDILNEDSGSMIPRPASDKDIADCQQDLIDLGLEPLPQDYIDFLKKHNGLAWNGIEYYSTDQVTEADNPDGYRLMDLVTMNDEFNERYELDEKVLLGRADEDYYTYNITTKKYEALELESREVWEECDTFDDLFFFTVGGRLGLNDDDEQQYEHDEGKYDGEVLEDAMKAKRKENKLPLGIRLDCWLCRKGILRKLCLVCPPV